VGADDRERRKWKDASGRDEAWVVDVQAVGKDGRMRRVRRVSAVQTRRSAEKLEHEIREELTRAGSAELADPADVPTLAEFSQRFMATCAATSNKPSEVESKRMILRVHLVPELGDCRLDRIGPPEILVPGLRLATTCRSPAGGVPWEFMGSTRPSMLDLGLTSRSRSTSPATPLEIMNGARVLLGDRACSRCARICGACRFIYVVPPARGTAPNTSGRRISAACAHRSVRRCSLSGPTPSHTIKAHAATGW
jgi:hypothetical protein